MTLPFVIRGVKADDIPFIFDGWMKQNRYAPISKHVPTKIYRPYYHAVLEDILKRSTVIVACNPDDETHTFGVLVWEPDPALFHWLYVKDIYAGQGLARALLTYAVPSLGTPQQPELICTSSGPTVFQNRSIVERYKLIYNPFLLFQGITP